MTGAQIAQLILVLGIEGAEYLAARRDQEITAEDWAELKRHKSANDLYLDATGKAAPTS